MKITRFSVIQKASKALACGSLLALAAFAATPSSLASIIYGDLRSVNGNNDSTVDFGLPVFLQGNANGGPINADFRFKIPHINRIGSLNSVEITLSIFDNGDRRGETGSFYVKQAGADQWVFDFPASEVDLRATSADSPYVYDTFLPSAALPGALTAVQQNNGFLTFKVHRDSGDFYVQNVTLTVDYTPVPEPSAALAMGFLLLGGVTYQVRRFKANKRATAKA